MAADINLKELLIKIILEYYKQELTFTRLEKEGVFLSRLLVKNLEIVFDVVGFPSDNAEEYDCRHEHLGEPRDESKKLIDENYFPDDWLREYYYDITRALSEEKNIVVTDEGIDISEANNLHLVSKTIGVYIEWLYNEYEKYKRGEKPWEQYFKDEEE